MFQAPPVGLVPLEVVLPEVVHLEAVLPEVVHLEVVLPEVVHLEVVLPEVVHMEQVNDKFQAPPVGFIPLEVVLNS